MTIRVLLLSSLIVTLILAQQLEVVRKPLIVGGRDATWGEVPYIASIRWRGKETFFGGGHRCGAALIDNMTLITAAHCFICVS